MPSLNSHHLYIVQSLKPGEVPIGEQLRDEIMKLNGLPCTLHNVAAEDDLKKLLADILRATSREHCPIIHFCMHGSGQSLYLSGNHHVLWDTLKNWVEPINWACENNLFLTFAVCKASWFASVVRPANLSPFWGLIGCREIVYNLSSRAAFLAFYESLFNDADLNAAMNIMNEVYEKTRLSNGATEINFYECITSEDMLEAYIGRIRDVRRAEINRNVYAYLLPKYIELMGEEQAMQILRDAIEQRLPDLLEKNLELARRKYLLKS